jgi:hypothetical protein
LCRKQDQHRGNQFVARLLSAGADINIRNKKGVSAVDLAPKQLQTQFQEELRNYVNVIGNMTSSFKQIYALKALALQEESQAVKLASDRINMQVITSVQKTTSTGPSTLSSHRRISSELREVKQLLVAPSASGVVPRNNTGTAISFTLPSTLPTPPRPNDDISDEDDRW